MKTYTHLQPEELSVICALRKLRFSCTAIAAQLKRAPSTVSREFRRMALSEPHACDGAPTATPTPLPTHAPYSVRRAQRDRAQKRRNSANNARRWYREDSIFDALIPSLSEQHSLAQAVGRLRREGESLGPLQRLPSRATLYRLAQPLGWFNRERYPSMRLRRYHSKTELRARAEHAPNGWVARCLSVEQRPVELCERTLPLYMEIDTIIRAQERPRSTGRCRLPTHPVYFDRLPAPLHRGCRGGVAAHSNARATPACARPDPRSGQ